MNIEEFKVSSNFDLNTCLTSYISIISVDKAEKKKKKN